MTDRPARLVDFAPAAVMAVGAALVLMVMSLQPPSAMDVPVAVVFAPGTSPNHVLAAVAQADLQVLQFGAVSSVVMLAEADAEARDLLTQAGAWFIADPQGLIGCFFTDAPNTLRTF